MYCDRVRSSCLGGGRVDGKSNDLWEPKRMTNGRPRARISNEGKSREISCLFGGAEFVWRLRLSAQKHNDRESFSCV